MRLSCENTGGASLRTCLFTEVYSDCADNSASIVNMNNLFSSFRTEGLYTNILKRLLVSRRLLAVRDCNVNDNIVVVYYTYAASSAAVSS